MRDHKMDQTEYPATSFPVKVSPEHEAREAHVNAVLGQTITVISPSDPRLHGRPSHGKDSK